MSSVSINVPELKLSQTELENYKIVSEVGTGGWGKVSLALRRSDLKVVALKFFGYTNRIPELSAINHEVGLMMSLIGVPGVVQIESLFYDTPNGFLKDKLYREPFPVIVMEMLSGGDILRRLINRVLANQIPTESLISQIFRGVATALYSIHEKSYIHRDLKYNNILFVSDRDDSPVKIIDFGSMTKLPEGDGACIRDELIGTPGFYAPESIARSEYSFKTDIWQLGCILYCLLCGHFPFSYQYDRRHDILAGKFRQTNEWNSLSSSARDLITSMLQVNPQDRLSLEEILRHPWVCWRRSEGQGSGEVQGQEQPPPSSEPMCSQYISRLQKLTESERVYNDLKDEDGFISREKILQALTLLEQQSDDLNIPSSSEHKLLPEPVVVAEGVGEEMKNNSRHISNNFDEETLEELLTQVTHRCSTDPMNHETFVHFFIMSTLTLEKKRRRTTEE